MAQWRARDGHRLAQSQRGNWADSNGCFCGFEVGALNLGLFEHQLVILVKVHELGRDVFAQSVRFAAWTIKFNLQSNLLVAGDISFNRITVRQHHHTSSNESNVC